MAIRLPLGQRWVESASQRAFQVTESSCKKMFRYVVAGVLGLVGLIFIGQGLGYIGGSRMTNDPFWALVGAALLVVASAVAIVTWRSRPS